MNLGALEFQPKDFYRAEFEPASEWFYERLAEIANAALRDRLAKAPEAFGSVTPQGVTGYRWFTKRWAGRTGRTTHRARLVFIEKIFPAVRNEMSGGGV